MNLYLLLQGDGRWHWIQKKKSNIEFIDLNWFAPYEILL